MTQDEIIHELGVDDAKFAELMAHGMPIEEDGSFDRLRCLGWLAVQGRLRRIVTRRELSQYFSTTEPNIRHWVSAGMPSLSADRFDLDDCIRWRLGKLAARQSESKEALLQAKADREELAADREASRLIDAYEIDAWRRQTVTSIRAMIDDFADLAYGVVDRGYSAEDARRAAEEKIEAIYADLQAGEEELRSMLDGWYQFLNEHFEDHERWLMIWRAFCTEVAPSVKTFDGLVARFQEIGFSTE